MSYICYLCLFVYSGIQHVLPISIMAGVYLSETGAVYFLQVPALFTPGLFVVCFAIV